MALVSIVAMNHDRVIGIEGDLPWRLPKDLAFFREVTLGNTVIMGRKTFESLGSKPLKGRRNIVVSRTLDASTLDVHVASSFEGALKEAGTQGDVVVIGGANLYQQAMPLIDTLYVTLVDNHVAGDVYFPYTLGELKQMGWKEVRSVAHDKDERHAYAFVCHCFKRG